MNDICMEKTEKKLKMIESWNKEYVTIHSAMSLNYAF